MSISFPVIILLTLYVGLAVLDQISIQIGLYTPLFGGVITGLLIGDIELGLQVGAALQLATLGVATYGGASVPDFLSGSVIGVAFAYLMGLGPEAAIALALPFGLLLQQLDILGRMTNVVFQHRAEKAAEIGDYRGVETSNLLGILPWTLSRMIPVFLALMFSDKLADALSTVFGPNASGSVKTVVDFIMSGLKTAGQLLPAMGIAILMRYLPIKKYFPFFIIGFVLMAFGSSYGLSLLGVALIGVALAMIFVMLKKDNSTPATANGANPDNDDEEVEIDG